MADSLYIKKQYTQSLELYKQIFNEHTYSPAMLLKMAYIEEGLGQNHMALYYINLYYEITHDATALHKMDDMATKYNLTGYELSPADHTLAIISENKNAITTAFGAISLVLLSIMIYTIRRHKIRPYISFSFFIVTVVFLITFANVSLKPINGITKNAPAYLMSGPSPGAKVVGIINEGNRLPIRGRHDVWVKVKWRDGYAYLKENQVLEVKL
ncbi:MAG: SH3 domain-containing protein [Bacteroidota bacterium]